MNWLEVVSRSFLRGVWDPVSAAGIIGFWVNGSFRWAVLGKAWRNFQLGFGGE